MTESKEKPFCVITAEVYRLQQDKQKQWLKENWGYDVGNRTETEWHTDPVLIERILREQEAAAKKDPEGSGNIGWFVHVYPGVARLAWDGKIHTGPMWTECVEIDVVNWMTKQVDKLDATNVETFKHYFYKILKSSRELIWFHGNPDQIAKTTLEQRLKVCSGELLPKPQWR
jgi:hypothetical protein